MRHIGIDEAGRGPLAGPVAVGAVLVPAGFAWNVLPGIGDSKKLTEMRREAVYAAARTLQQNGVLDFQVALVGGHVIDDIGVVGAVNRGMERVLCALKTRNGFACDEVVVKLDGALHAPSRFIHQETIIGGDGLLKSIGLASILAKVTRDRFMVRLATRYPEYGFEVHKGYGTKGHRARIREHGLSAVHRHTFCTRLSDQD